MKKITRIEITLATITFIFLYMISNAHAKQFKENDKPILIVKKYIESVHDGDTFKIKNDDEIGILKGLDLSVRIYGIDTPEISKASACEKRLGFEATKFLKDLLPKNKLVKLKVYGWDSFTRIVADVIVDEVLVSDLLIKKGYAIPYYGDKKKHVWCKD